MDQECNGNKDSIILANGLMEKKKGMDNILTLTPRYCIKDNGRLEFSMVMLGLLLLISLIRVM